MGKELDMVLLPVAVALLFWFFFYKVVSEAMNR